MRFVITLNSNITNTEKQRLEIISGHIQSRSFTVFEEETMVQHLTKTKTRLHCIEKLEL